MSQSINCTTSFSAHKAKLVLLFYLYSIIIGATICASGFDETTFVHTKSGVCAIGNLHVNQKLLSCLPNAHATSFVPVKHVFQKTVVETVHITIGTTTIITASDQLLYDAFVRKWVKAHRLVVGQFLQTVSGNPIPIVGIQSVPYPNNLIQLSVSAPHIFAIGPEGILAHNEPFCIGAAAGTFSFVVWPTVVTMTPGAIAAAKVFSIGITTYVSYIIAADVFKTLNVLPKIKSFWGLAIQKFKNMFPCSTGNIPEPPLNPGHCGTSLNWGDDEFLYSTCPPAPDQSYIEAFCGTGDRIGCADIPTRSCGLTLNDPEIIPCGTSQLIRIPDVWVPASTIEQAPALENEKAIHEYIEYTFLKSELPETPPKEVADAESEEASDEEQQCNKLPFFKQNEHHIFRKKGGHIPDTPENRKLLIETASDPANFLGTDEDGNKWFAKMQADGKQVWATVRDEMIRNAGLNDLPRKFNEKTGLCRPVPNRGKNGKINNT